MRGTGLDRDAAEGDHRHRREAGADQIDRLVGPSLAGITSERHDGVDPYGRVGRRPYEQPGRGRQEQRRSATTTTVTHPTSRTVDGTTLRADDDLAGVRIPFEPGEAFGKLARGRWSR